MLSQWLEVTEPLLCKWNSSSSFNHLIKINLMNILDLIHRYDQWGMRQNHTGRRNNNRLDDPNLLLISSQAAAQLEEVENLLQARTGAENVNDRCSYSWGSPRCSSKKAYSTLIGITAASPLFKSLWASSNLGKHKFLLLSTPQG